MCVFFFFFVYKFRECNKADKATWENLTGVRVTAEPDLRLFKKGALGVENTGLMDVAHTKLIVSVVEVNIISRMICKKLFKSEI